LGANVFNVAANWMLIYGNWGAPALGVVGAAWATTLARWVMFAALAAYVFGRPALRRFHVLAPRGRIDRALLSRLLRLGGPVGTQYGMEIGIFTAATVMMGWIGTTALASHQVAINLCSITFMVPYGFAATAAVRVGHAIGRDDVAAARHAAWVCYVLGVGFMVLSAIVFATLGEPLARLYTADAAVVALAAQLLLVGAVFQLFDGGQTIGIGALRGAADTRLPMFVTIVAYWGVGLPLGWWLAFRGGLGPIGLWWGLTAGLVLVAVTLAIRFRLRVRAEHLVHLKAHA
jgi:MATE family multidrug resistance protein